MIEKARNNILIFVGVVMMTLLVVVGGYSEPSVGDVEPAQRVAMVKHNTIDLEGGGGDWQMDSGISLEAIEPEPTVEPVVEPTAEPTEDPTTEPVVEPTVEAVEEPQEATPAPIAVSYSGTKVDWMAGAGIPQSEWEYVDYIVSRESGWNPHAINPSSGACGLAQSLPCAKSEVYGAWNDPVAQLKWQYDYVVGRYGSYAGAANHSRAYGWY